MVWEMFLSKVVLFLALLTMALRDDSNVRSALQGLGNHGLGEPPDKAQFLGSAREPMGAAIKSRSSTLAQTLLRS